MPRNLAPLLLLLVGSACVPAAAEPPLPGKPDRKAAAWVKKTLAKMTLDERIAQLVVPGLAGVFTPTDSEAADKLERLVRERRVGGFHVFGGSEALPMALLNPVYGTTGGRVTKGDALAIAALLNRLQRAPRCRSSSPPTSRAAPATSWTAPRACRARWRSARRATPASPSARGGSRPARGARSAFTWTTTRWST
jgi:hypothetical protein